MPPARVICPFCSCAVNIEGYGYGWIGVCCGKIIYNSHQLPWINILEAVKTEEIASHSGSFSISPGRAKQGFAHKFTQDMDNQS